MCVVFSRIVDLICASGIMICDVTTKQRPAIFFISPSQTKRKRKRPLDLPFVGSCRYQMFKWPYFVFSPSLLMKKSRFFSRPTCTDKHFVCRILEHNADFRAVEICGPLIPFSYESPYYVFPEHVERFVSDPEDQSFCRTTRIVFSLMFLCAES